MDPHVSQQLISSKSIVDTTQKAPMVTVSTAYHTNCSLSIRTYTV